MCGTRNQSLARFCRHCGAAIRSRSFWPSRLSQAPDTVFHAPGVRIALNEPLWIPPVSCGGMLWILTGRGNLYRYIPGSAEVERLAGLGEGFGQAPLLVRTVRPEGPGAGENLWLLAASAREVRAYGLLDGRVRTVFRCDGAKVILADCVQDSTVIEADRGHLYWIQKEDKTLSLQALDVARGEIRWSVPLKSGETAGVVAAADLVFVCSKEQLTACRTTGPATGDPRSHEILLPAEFEPRIRPHRHHGGPMPAPGCMMLTALREWLYIPGRHRGSHALLALNACRPSSDAKIVPLEKESVFDSTGAGLYCWTTQGRVLRLREGGFEELLSDAQISPAYPSFADGLLKVAFVETPQGEKIRFYRRQRHTDCDVAVLEGFADCVSLCGVGDSIALAYTDRNEMGHLAVWKA